MASVRTQPCVWTVLLVFSFCSFVSSLYFRVGDSEEKCFTEEIPDETMLIGSYRIQLSDQQRDEDLPVSQDLRMHIVAKGPDDELILSRQHDSEGKFTFTSHKPGRYQICLRPKSSNPGLSAGGVLTVHLDIKVGERTNNYTEIAAKEKLTMLQLRVRQLAEQVDQIQKEQNYQRVREKHFQEVSHSTNMWIFWWPVARSLYVVAVITWHTNSW
ncbi:transmembrane emp24 domain-containing protein 9-like [Toxotes jaculatrix]|uniref:transmembrane emp24 domain-containing protein 9-like n=1 Tax=Toxotes jaculatrix TaxID=941984 RepID=UPI001B3AFD72|nr:transmembrane emp24 domain-containing protein 9-like [Toxotes jaculatrix]